MRFAKKRLKPRLLVVYAFTAALVWLARPTPIMLAAGVLPIGVGVALRVWATGYLFKNDELTTAGPYAFMRHPLYLGTLLIFSGFAIMAASPVTWSLFVLFLAAYFAYYLPYKDRIEAARLEELYGDSYLRYAIAVPRLIPRLHAYQPLRGDVSGRLHWQEDRFKENHELGTAVGVAFGVAAMFGRWTLL